MWITYSQNRCMIGKYGLFVLTFLWITIKMIFVKKYFMQIYSKEKMWITQTV